MAEFFLVRKASPDSQRHLEVHAVHDADDERESRFVPLVKVVDMTLGLRSFSNPGTATTPKLDFDPAEAPSSDDLLSATDAAAAVVAFFSEEPDNNLAFFVPDEHMDQFPKELIDGLPASLAEGIRSTIAQPEPEIAMRDYDPTGPYL